MHLLRSLVNLLLIQPIFSEKIRLKNGEITYEYDNACPPLGDGATGVVYSGMRIEGKQSQDVVFKVLWDKRVRGEFLNEKNMYEMMGHHDSLPRFYDYLPETNETKDIIVVERMGKSLRELWRRNGPFSSKAAMKIGLQILDVLEWMHSNGFTHNDLHTDNVAVGYKNDSKIYLFDFNFATKDLNETMDLICVSNILNDITQSKEYKLDIGVASVVREFSLIAQQYENIHDIELRTQTFAKLRKILWTELEKYSDNDNDGEYRGFKQ